ncbi:MAG TPA: acetyltransferase [Deltaproteobacteria bacterium]|nr:acetyltransferase [Deltaproteobacteria bacterium]
MAGEKTVIVGDSPIAEVAYEYLTYDSCYTVVAFTVDQEFIKRDHMFEVPIVPFEEVDSYYPPNTHKMFVAVGYPQMNRLRAKFFKRAKEKGYALISYISSKAFVWRNVKIGENCFIMENNVIQPFVRIGNNVTIWSGNHIGHHSVIGDNVFIASHAVISGFVEIGEYCFIGVNSTIANNIRVAKNSLLGAGSIILKDTEEGKIYGAKNTVPKQYDVFERFKIDTGEII